MHLFIIHLTCDWVCRAGEAIKDLLVFTSKGVPSLLQPCQLRVAPGEWFMSGEGPRKRFHWWRHRAFSMGRAEDRLLYLSARCFHCTGGFKPPQIPAPWNLTTLASGNELWELMIWELELLLPQLWGLEIAREFGFTQFGHQYNNWPKSDARKGRGDWGMTGAEWHRGGSWGKAVPLLKNWKAQRGRPRRRAINYYKTQKAWEEAWIVLRAPRKGELGGIPWNLKETS